MAFHYPLAAVVGAERLKLALCIAAIDPGIGGVLIEGPRGMAKSTLARGLADLLEQAPFVTLPLGASEDRVVGSLNLDAVLSQGKIRFAPGLLAKADGGVLYVDEVNLLPDPLVDLLLDVAASGVNRVERDGVSHEHSARFVLIGTMNPEEGELRPQLLDRFGLNVALDARPDPTQRREIITRRLAFDADPAGFVARWAEAQALLSQRCQQARSRLASIPLDDLALEAITQACYQAAVDGLRADLVWLRAARAHAAWRNAPGIELEDIEAVAEFALRHRRHAQTGATQRPPSEQGGSESQDDAQAGGDWGALPPQPVASGPRLGLAAWPKKS
jgi:magnesium chelatase subunit I